MVNSPKKHGEAPKDDDVLFYICIYLFFLFFRGGFPFYEEGDLLVFIHFYFSYEDKHEQK